MQASLKEGVLLLLEDKGSTKVIWSSAWEICLFLPQLFIDSIIYLYQWGFIEIYILGYNPMLLHFVVHIAPSLQSVPCLFLALPYSLAL